MRHKKHKKIGAVMEANGCADDLIVDGLVHLHAREFGLERRVFLRRRIPWDTVGSSIEGGWRCCRGVRRRIARSGGWPADCRSCVGCEGGGKADRNEPPPPGGSSRKADPRGGLAFRQLPAAERLTPPPGSSPGSRKAAEVGRLDTAVAAACQCPILGGGNPSTHWPGGGELPLKGGKARFSSPH